MSAMDWYWALWVGTEHQLAQDKVQAFFLMFSVVLEISCSRMVFVIKHSVKWIDIC